MTIPHQDEWNQMTPDQKLEALRHAQFGQEVWVRLLIEAVERLGVTFTMGGADAEDDAPCS